MSPPPDAFFAAFALAGLCAVPANHTETPAALAKRAREIGEAMAETFGVGSEPDSDGGFVVHFSASEAGNLSPERIRDIIRDHLEELATKPGA